MNEIVNLLKEVVAHDGGVRYEREGDEIGTRCCCHVNDYEPHLDTCFVPRAAALLAGMQAQPPAEAQAQGGGEVVERVAIAIHRAYNSMLDDPDFPEGWPGWQGATPEEREFFLKHAREAVTAPPSAPVGVEAALEALWRAVDKADRNMWEDAEELRAAVATVHRELSQQPAADGGFSAADMMVARQEGREEAQQPAADGGFSAADMMVARQEGREEAQQLAAVDGAMAGWIADGDTIPDYLIEETRDAIRQEFGISGTDGYYKRILVRVFRALAAAQEKGRG